METHHCQPIRLYLLTSLLCLLPRSELMVSAFTQVTTPSVDLAGIYTIDVSNNCDDQSTCQTGYDNTSCVDFGICSIIQCNGRSAAAQVEYPMEEWETLNDQSGCQVSKESPPGTFSKHNANTLIVNSSADSIRACFERNISTAEDIFTLTFWLMATCTNCSILELPVTSGPSIHLRVNGINICVKDKTNCAAMPSNNSWTMITVRVIRDRITIFLGSDPKPALTNGLTNVGAIENVFVGSGKIASIHDVYKLYDVRYYNGALTSREIEELFTGVIDATIKEPHCKCPTEYPDHQVSNLCTNGSATLPRYVETVVYHGPEAITDANVDTNWASAGVGTVNITVHFQSVVYHIGDISITFYPGSGIPGSVTCVFMLDGHDMVSQTLTCQQQQCTLLVIPTDLVQVTKASYEKLKADGVRLILQHADHLDSHSFIVIGLSINASCDCNSNAETCTITNDGYTCNCSPDTHTEGPKCASCVANYYREIEDFSCPHTCNCADKGVENVTNKCQEIGGQCLCKSNVEGTKCDTCKFWTHGLESSNTDGCTPCICNDVTVLACSNVTGDCTCKANTAPPNCTVCKDNYWGLISNNRCQPCACNVTGTVGQITKCQDADGQCNCKSHVKGKDCGTCKFGYFNLDTANPEGCTSCECHRVGVQIGLCNPTSGQCYCREGVNTDRKCTPKVSGVDPLYGPKVGGTHVTISGNLLGNFTHMPAVFMGNVKQHIVDVSDSAIVFMTASSSHNADLEIKLSWKGVDSPTVLPFHYNYRPTPVLKLASNTKYTTFLSGGCLIHIHGTNQDSVKYPRLEVINQDEASKVTSERCHHVLGHVVCHTPNMKSIYTGSNATYVMKTVFDGTSQPRDVEIKVFPDPVFETGVNVRFQYPFEKTIKIIGSGLVGACQENGYSVLIGVIHCTIEHFSNTEIECEPPQSAPGGIRTHELEVSIGNVEQIIGTLEYFEFHETTGFIIIMCCISGVVVIAVGIIIICCYCRRRRHRKPASKYTQNYNKTFEPQQQQRKIDECAELRSPVTSNGANGTNCYSTPVHVETIIKEPKKGIVNSSAEESTLIEDFLPHVEQGLRDEIRLCYVGRRHFTLARNPLLRGSKTVLSEAAIQKNGSPILKLTVKSLMEPVAETEDSLFPAWANKALSECLRLRRHTHAHVLNIHGIGIEPQRFHILYPYMAQGTLKNVVSDTSKEFSIRQLLGFSQQVIKGVAFLTSKEITHKDIAARNCMVDDKSVVKLCDASLCWDVYKNEYVYDEQKERYLPLRWMAPESITDGYYDTSTDVWSFAVMIWELLTRGCLPFHEVTEPSQVKEFILEGYVLGKPETLSDDLYDVLQVCWSHENELRPTISNLSKSLDNILSDDIYDNPKAIGSNVTQSYRRKNKPHDVYQTTNLSIA